MSRSKPIHTLLAGLLLLTACNKPLTLPTTGSPKIVFLGELIAGDSVYLRAAQSVPVIEGGSTERVLIDGLQVSVSSPQDGLWNLQSEADDGSESEKTLPFFSGNIIQADRSYRVTGLHPKFGTATADVSIPRPFTATLTDTISVDHLGEPCYRVRLAVQDLPEAGNYYSVEVVQQTYFSVPTFLYNGTWYVQEDNLDLYDSLQNAGIDPQMGYEKRHERMFTRIPFYCEDAFALHVVTGGEQEETGRSIFTDETANGGTYNCTVYIPKKYIMDSQPEFYGFTTLVQVKSLSKDYFSYLKNYQSATNQYIFDLMSNKIVIAGNVTNGLGVVGGVFRRQFAFDL